MAEDNQTRWLQDRIKENLRNHSAEEIHYALQDDPKLAEIYKRMTPIFTPPAEGSWGQYGRYAQMGAEQLVKGVPSIVSLPGNLYNLANQLMSHKQEDSVLPELPSWVPTSQRTDALIDRLERTYLTDPIVPRTQGEKLAAFGASALGGSLGVPLAGATLGAGSRLAGRVGETVAGGAPAWMTNAPIPAPRALPTIQGTAGGTVAGELAENYPELGPAVPAIAGMAVGGALGPTTAMGQRAGLLPRGRSYNDVLDSYNVSPLPGGNPPTRVSVATQMKNQLAHDIQDPSGLVGSNGVVNTNLDMPTVQSFLAKRGAGALQAVQDNPELAQDFANSPSRAPILREGGRAVLGFNPDKHVPGMDQAGTLRTFFGRDADIIRREHLPGAAADAEDLRHQHLMRWLQAGEMGTFGDIVGQVAAPVAHLDPYFGHALGILGAALPFVPAFSRGMMRALPGVPEGVGMAGTTGVAQTTKPADLDYYYSRVIPGPGSTKPNPLDPNQPPADVWPPIR